MKIIPGILEKDWTEIERKIELVRPFSNTIHIDIIDGKFAPNITFLDPKPFEKYKNEVFFELHMMVEEPINYLKPWADAGFKRFLGHIEKMPDQVEFVAQGQLLGEVGLAIDAKTSLDAIKIPYEDLDEILIMTVNAGFSGQKFMPEMLEKVKKIRNMNILNAEGLPIPIGVDGGISEQTIIKAKQSGANCFTATSCIFNSQTPKLQYEKLEKIINI